MARVIPRWQHLVKHLILGGQPFRAAMDAEIRRQFQLCADNGRRPTRLSHLDSHQARARSFPVCGNCVWHKRRHMESAVFRVPWCPTLRIIRRSVGGIALQSLARIRVQQVGAFLPALAWLTPAATLLLRVSEDCNTRPAAGRARSRARGAPLGGTPEEHEGFAKRAIPHGNSIGIPSGKHCCPRSLRMPWSTTATASAVRFSRLVEIA